MALNVKMHTLRAEARELGAPLEVPRNVNSAPLKFDFKSFSISSDPPDTDGVTLELNIVR